MSKEQIEARERCRDHPRGFVDSCKICAWLKERAAAKKDLLRAAAPAPGSPADLPGKSAPGVLPNVPREGGAGENPPKKIFVERRRKPRPDPLFMRPAAPPSPGTPGAPGANPPPPLVFTRREAAAMLKLSLASLQELLHQGAIKGVPIGSRIMIRREELERFLLAGVRRIWLPKNGGKSVRFPRPPEGGGKCTT
jgi:excisionase family DNA binding protein